MGRREQSVTVSAPPADATCALLSRPPRLGLRSELRGNVQPQAIPEGDASIENPRTQVEEGSGENKKAAAAEARQVYSFFWNFPI